MPLLIFLKQPNRAIAVKGEEKDLIEIGTKNEDFNFFNFRTLKNKPIVISKDDVAYIELVSEEELKKQKTEYENRLKQERQRSGQLVHPNFLFPSNRK